MWLHVLENRCRDMNLARSKVNISSQSRKLLAFTLVVSLLLTIWASSSHLWDQYRVVTDVQDYYWMALAQDPTLFARDYLFLPSNYVVDTNVLGFRLLLAPRSLGHGLFYYLASTAVSYIWLFKLSILVLVPLCVVYLFKVGQFLEDDLTGVSLSFIFTFFILASPLSLSMGSGLPRGFSIPILVLFLCYLIRQQYLGAGVMILIGSLVYLPTFPPMVLTYAFALVRVKRPLKLSLSINRSNLMPFVGSLLISALVVGLALAAQLNFIPSSTPAGFVSNSVGNVPISNNPYYQSEGPVSLFLSFPFLGRAGIFNTGGDVVNFLVMLIIGFLIYKTVGSKSLQRIPGVLWGLLAAGLIMYALSLFFVLGLSSFALYLPSRYTRSTLFMFMLFFVGLNWVDFLHELPNWLRKNAQLLIFFILTLGLAFAAIYVLTPNRPLLIPTFWLVGLIMGGVLTPLGGGALYWLATQKLSLKDLKKWGTLLALGVIVIYIGTVYIGILGLKTINPSEQERNLYEFVATLPKDTVLVGDPDIMTNIPLFSKRSVLFRGLFPRGDAPIVEYFDAQYAETTQPMLEFCQQYQIDYLVLDRRDFDPDYVAQGDFFYEPWNSRISTRVRGRSNFVLLQLEPVFASGPFEVIRCDSETILAGK